MDASRPATAFTNSFDCYSTAQLNVPKGAKEAYASTEPWNNFVNIDDCLEADIPIPDQSLYGVHLADATVKKGVVNRVPVYLTNDEPIVSFNCDIVLPEGLSLAKNDKGKYDIERGERCDDTFAVVSNDVNGNVRILCYSSDNTALDDTEDPVLYLNISLDDNAELGTEYTVKIINCSMTTEEMKDILAPDTSAILTLPAYTPGDVNGDGRYNSTDVSLAIQYVMEIDAPNGIREAADVNGDGRINSTDISLIVSYVIEGRSPQLRKPAIPAADVLSIYPENLAVKKGETGYLPVVLNNPGMEVISLDCNIWLPEGVTIETKKDKPIFELSDRADDHVITGNLLADGSYRVLLYSPTNSPIDGEDGVIFTIPIKVEADKGDYQVEIYDGTVNELVDGEIVAHDCEAATSILTVKGETSAIEVLGSDAEAEYYDLNGFRVKNPVPGVYIVKTRNGVQKVVVR